MNESKVMYNKNLYLKEYIVRGIIFRLRLYFNDVMGSLKTVFVHLLASGIASVYVLSQELKYHSLGGNKVYDSYDLIASINGLAGTLVIIQLFGFIDESKIESVR